MSTLPADGYLDDAARTVAEQKAAFNALRDFLAEAPGGGTTSALTLVSGAATPAVGASRVFSIIGEGSTSDTLTNIVDTNAPEGSWMWLRCDDAADVITVLPSAGGTGQFSTRYSEICILDDTGKWLLVQLVANVWIERARFGFEVDTLRSVTVKTGAYTLLAQDSGKTFSNEGAGAIVVLTLPAAVAGLEYAAIVQDVDGIRLQCGAGDTVRNAGSVSAAAGKLENSTVGSAVRIKAINATEWITVSAIGTWVAT